MSDYDLAVFHFGHTSLSVIFWNATHRSRRATGAPRKAFAAMAAVFSGQ